MAVKRPAPWWMTWAFAVALVAIFMGERLLGGKGAWQWIFSGGGVLAVLATTAWRGMAWSQATGERGRVERILFFGKLGCVVALGIYFAGREMAGTEPSKFWTAMAVIWPILLACSLLPTLAAEWAVGSRHATAGADADNAHAEAHRVAEVAISGLTVALIGSFLCVVMYIVGERDKKIDVSYFKTSSPGTATRNMVSSLGDQLDVLLFFPPVNEVKDEVLGYMKELAGTTSRIKIHELDRMVASEEAEKYRVTKDGTVTLVRGDQHHNILLDTDLNRARSKLRELDDEVQRGFLKVFRDARTAYLVVGHQELNDDEDKSFRGDPTRKVGVIRELLKLLNYQVKDLGVSNGLAQDVPDDATIVLILGPQKPFLDAELEALDRYLKRGGALLMALEPGTDVVLGPLEARLGVRFEPAPLTDDKVHIVVRRTEYDRRNLITDQFSSHASVTTLSQARTGAGILFLGAGSLDNAEFAADWGSQKPKRTYVIRSLKSAFRDANNNYQADGEGEPRASYNLAAAIEGPKLDGDDKPADPHQPADADKLEVKNAEKDDKKADKASGPRMEKPETRMRALVLADVQLLSDAVLNTVALNRGLLLDAIKWLGGEEKFTGETTSEKDVPIAHTTGKDVVWFYSTIIGAPALVLGLGLFGVSLRRRRRKA
jgi:hypothetical protein